MNPLLSERAEQGFRDLIGAARLRHHLAEHRAQPEHDADEADDAAEPRLKRLHDLRHRHSGDEAEEQGGERQRDEWMDPKARNQQHETHHCDQRIRAGELRRSY